MQAIAIAGIATVFLAFLAHEIATRKRRKLRSPEIYRGIK